MQTGRGATKGRAWEREEGPRKGAEPEHPGPRGVETAQQGDGKQTGGTRQGGRGGEARGAMEYGMTGRHREKRTGHQDRDQGPEGQAGGPKRGRGSRGASKREVEADRKRGPKPREMGGRTERGSTTGAHGTAPTGSNEEGLRGPPKDGAPGSKEKKPGRR